MDNSLQQMIGHPMHLAMPVRDNCHAWVHVLRRQFQVSHSLSLLSSGRETVLEQVSAA
jgi:hypothetical protein